MLKASVLNGVFVVCIFVILLVYAAIPSFWDEHLGIGLFILAVLALALACKAIFFPQRKDEQEKFGVEHTHRSLSDIQRERLAAKKKK